MKFTAIAALAAAVSFTAPAFAAVELDVNALVGMPSGGRIFQESGSVQNGPNGWDLGQTFTAGKTGKLDTIGLQAYNVGVPTTYTLTVYSGNVTGGSATVLGSASFTSQSQSAFLAGGITAIDLSALNIQMTAGTLYSYEVSTARSATPTPSGRLNWAIGTANADFSGAMLNQYEGGRSYRETYTGGLSNGWDTSGNFAVDRGFSTFVEVAPVPEPGEWAMIVAGLGIVGATARRRRKA